jgi:hypothetical protein
MEKNRKKLKKKIKKGKILLFFHLLKKLKFELFVGEFFGKLLTFIQRKRKRKK